MKNRHIRFVILLALSAFTTAGAIHAEAAEKAPSFESLLAAARSYEYGQSRAALLGLEKAVHAGSGFAVVRERMASKLAEVLRSDATPDCKKFLCRQLSLIGSGKQVPVLASLLSDETLGLSARAALERIPGEEATAAIRAALPKSSGLDALGLMDTLGKRRDDKAIPLIAVFLRDKGPLVAAGAAAALGKIGGKEAMAQLMKADDTVSTDVRLAVNHALLSCADGLVAGGHGADTAEVYRTLTEPGRPAQVRLAAFPGLVASRRDGGASLVLDALGGEDAALRRAAIRSLRTFGGKQTIVAVSQRLAGLNPEAQVQVVNALADRGDRAARSGIQGLLASDNTTVRLASVAALGTLGDGSTVDALTGLLADADLGEAAFRSLVRIEGPGVEDALVRVLRKGNATERARVAAVLRERHATGAASALVNAAADEDATVRKEALKAVGALGSASDCDGLIKLLAGSGATGDTRYIQSAISVLCARHAGACDAVAKAAAQASGAARMSLLAILGKTGGKEALRVLNDALKDHDPSVRTTAIKAVSEWPDAEPLASVAAFLRAEKEIAPKALGFRAFVALAGKDTSRSPDDMASRYAEALNLASRPDDRKTMIAGLGDVASPVALRLAASRLGDEEIVNEAAMAVVKIAPSLLGSHPRDVKTAVEAVLKSCKLESARVRAKDILHQLSKPINLARSATASSPDGLEKDGAAGGDQAAIDGDPNTYWDEANGKQLYILKLDFKRAVTAGSVAITGYQQDNYAPRDFEIVCDGKTVKTVSNAKYTQNRLLVDIPPTTLKCLELKITKSYGASPAIREIELYGPESVEKP